MSGLEEDDQSEDNSEETENSRFTTFAVITAIVLCALGGFLVWLGVFPVKN